MQALYFWLRMFLYHSSLLAAGKSVGEFKPPKLRANDEDKLYVRRPVKEEELRPPPAPSQKANNAPKPQPPKPL
jgi:hypothetical protein